MIKKKLVHIKLYEIKESILVNTFNYLRNSSKYVNDSKHCGYIDLNFFLDKIWWNDFWIVIICEKDTINWSENVSDLILWIIIWYSNMLIKYLE